MDQIEVSYVSKIIGLNSIDIFVIIVIDQNILLCGNLLFCSFLSNYVVLIHKDDISISISNLISMLDRYSWYLFYFSYHFSSRILFDDAGILSEII